MSEQKSLFQGPIYPNPNSGELPTQEGLVIFPQTLVGLGGGQFVIGKSFFARTGYFFEFWFNSFVEPGGSTMFLRAYPPGTDPATIGNFLSGKADFSLDLSDLNEPAKIVIPPGWPIVPVWFNGGLGSKAFTSIAGLHLKDCPPNNRHAII